MYLIDPAAHTRRAFLRRSGQLAMAGTALPFALNLAAMGEAAAQAAPDDDYKALVCVFLFGGNDYANTVITYDDPSYNAYSTIRGAAGRAAASRSPRTRLTRHAADADHGAAQRAPVRAAPVDDAAGRACSTPTARWRCSSTSARWWCRSRARSTTTATRSSIRMPPKLFSHNDQQSTWQSSSPEGSTVGWGGNIGDLALRAEHQLAVHLHLGRGQRGVPVGRHRRCNTRSAPTARSASTA